METLTVKIKYHDKDIERIEKIPQGDWIDLRAAEDVELMFMDSALISLGISMKLPNGYEAYIAPRSSTFKKWGIIQTNSIGIVDESYCGTNDVWKMPVVALRDTKINKGDRICQFRIVKKMNPIDFIEVDKMEDEDRGGFGSTGSN